MNAPDGFAPAADHSLSGPAPEPLPGLRAAIQRRQATAHGRRWASKKRRQLEARLGELRAARAAGLSLAEIREQLSRENIHVSRWLLHDLLRLSVRPPAGPPSF